LAGLSKTHGLPGLRAGWLVSHDEELRARLMNWKFYTSICPPAPTELLAMMALKTGEQIIDRNRRIVKENVEIAESFFKRWSKFFDWRPPMAGSVALVGVQVPSATDYCHELAREVGVLLLPSPYLGYDDRHVRFGFGRKSFPEALAKYDHHLESLAQKAG
jgi:aspartate/methionine/tyrosine aminotransferase